MRKLFKFLDNAIWIAWDHRPVLTTNRRRFEAKDAEWNKGYRAGHKQAEEILALYTQINAKVHAGEITGDDIRFACQLAGV